MTPPIPTGVTAIVAAHDSASSIRETVRALLDRGVPVLVVDDGSTDDTAEIAARAGARVLRLPANVGKGGAVAAGVASTPQASVYLLVDADVGATASAAIDLVGPVDADEADMVIGVLPSAGRRGGLGSVRRLAAWGIERATGRAVAAPLSGQRAIRGDLLRRTELAPRFGLETALTIDARRAGARVLEVPVAMDHDHTGRSLAGFRHRAGQGADVARALWSRLTTFRVRVTAIVLATLVVLGAGWWSAGKAEPSSVPLRGRASKVVIIGIPHLGWRDVGSGRMHTLDQLVERGAVGAMTVRTLSRHPNVTEAYASLGAGGRVKASPGTGRVGQDARGARVVDSAAIQRENRGRHLPTLPGALGDALHRRGLKTAVVGPVAGAAVMDRGGVIDHADPAAGDVGPAVVEALAVADVVVVDDGLRGGDETLGRIVPALPTDARLVVVSVVPPSQEWQLTPIVVAGAGLARGELVSPSTRRQGLVTLADLAPTVLESLGVRPPAEMIGHALRTHPGRADLGALARVDRDAVYRERIYLPIAVWYIVVQAVVYALAVFGFALGLLRARRAELLRTAVLAIAAFPLATFVFRAVPDATRFGGAAFAVILTIDAALVALVWRRRRHPLDALAWLLGLTSAVLLVDVCTGAHLQQASIMGYSAHTATRFYGLGNTAFAVLAATSILAASVHLERAPRRTEALVAVGCFLGLVAAVDGAPALGDDVGGILTLVPVVALLVVALAGWRISWKALAGVAAVTVAVLAIAIGIDLLRPPEARTHLGRFVADVRHDGSTPLVSTMARKASTNARVLRATVWTWMVPIVAALMLSLLVWQRRGAELLPPGSSRRAAVVAALAAGLIGFAVNDSGVVVTALVLVYIGPFLVLLALEGTGAAQLLQPGVPAATARRPQGAKTP